VQFPDLDAAIVDEVSVVLQQNISLGRFSEVFPDLVFADGDEAPECL